MRQALRVAGTVVDAWRAVRGGRAAIAERQRRRLRDLVTFARAHSPYYRSLYEGLPRDVDDVAALPVTSKRALMARFDDWATDRRVTEAAVRAFVARAERIGDWFLGQYTIVTTSGTSGYQGLFLLDRGSFAVAAAMGARMLGSWLGVREILRVLARGRRLAMVNAMGGHFASAVAATRLLRRRARRVAVFAADMPVPQIVEGLNAFRPALLAPYASLGAVLAREQAAGRLHVDPVLLVLSAEGLPPGEQERIARAFGAIVRDSYAATECPFLSYRCGEGWLHVNADWVVVEPVDADHRAVSPGTASHTVLVTNLGNRVQPVLRYDLGDSVLQRPDPCPCGSPLPAIQVQGRSADVLTLPGRGERSVTLAPLAVDALVDGIPGLERLQVVQTDTDVLRVRTRLTESADADAVWHAISMRLAELLTRHDASAVRLERAEEPPAWTPGGKFRTVIPRAAP